MTNINPFAAPTNRPSLWFTLRRAIVMLLMAALPFITACGPTEGPTTAEAPAAQERPKYMFVIHGGAGAFTRDDVTPEQEAVYRDALAQALHTGQAVLERGGSALDAVEAAIRFMEDSPLFNAGRGAVLTAEGTVELDASLMDGRTLNAGAVAGVKRTKNPIALARQVMEQSPHVMLVGEGAEAFAKEQGLEIVPETYFFNQRPEDARQSGRAASAHPSALGTVGAVALDQDGNLAAGTSTGGLVNKRIGRVGDSPIIGAGTYASNASCAVSATGHGEYFIRNVVAHDISARMIYAGASLQQAADAVIMERLVEQRAQGGVVAVDRHGNIAMPYNTAGMLRGYIGPDGQAVVKIWDE